MHQTVCRNNVIRNSIEIGDEHNPRGRDVSLGKMQQVRQPAVFSAGAEAGEGHRCKYEVQ